MSDGSTIQNALAEVLGVSEAAISGVMPMDEGTNAVYSARIENYGPSPVILKQQTVTRDGSFFAEPLVQERVRKSAGVPTPRVIATAFDDPPLQNRFFVMEAVEGQHPLHSKDASELIPTVKSLGRTLGAIHNAPYDFESAGEVHASKDSDDWYIENNETWRQQLTRTLFNVLDDAESQFTTVAEEMAEHYEKAADGIPNEYIRLLHGDYRFDNVLVNPSDDSVASVLDWGRVVAGDPIYNTARTAYLIRRDFGEEPEAAEALVNAFYEGYAANRPLDRQSDDFIRRRGFYVIHTAAVEMRWFSTWYSNWSDEQLANRRQMIVNRVRRAINRTST